MRKILILADDLSGAADCANACMSSGLSALVSFNEMNHHFETEVLSIDCDTRHLCSLRRREMPSVAIYGKNLGLKVMIHLIEANQCTETGTHTCVGAVRCSGEVVSENEDFSHESLLPS